MNSWDKEVRYSSGSTTVTIRTHMLCLALSPENKHSLCYRGSPLGPREAHWGKVGIWFRNGLPDADL